MDGGMTMGDLADWGLAQCDVAIAGGGPAGCAAALALRAHAPGLTVVVVEASAYEQPRLGETLPPLARQILDHLGVWQDFLAQGHRPVHGTTAAWGSATPHAHDYLFGTQGSGWHLDRAAFDALLAAAADRRGVAVLRRTRVRSAERAAAGRSGNDAGDWRLALAGPRGAGTLRARFLIDATGPAAALARRAGARRAALDRLTGYGRWFEEAGRSDGGSETGESSGLGDLGAAGAPHPHHLADPRVLVEAFADGFWYTAGLPGGRRVAACLTDADVGRRLRLAEAGSWERALAATTHVRRRLEGARHLDAGGAPAGACPPGGAGAPAAPLVRPAHSQVLQPAAGAGWLAAGDAASLFEPLSAQGIVKALRGGIFAAYAAGDLLAKGDPRGLDRYARLVQDEFAGYARARARIYAEERRWPESAFWRRRRSAA